MDFYCKCSTCPCFCVEDNFDGYLCEGCDPYMYDEFEDEGDDEDG